MKKWMIRLIVAMVLLLCVLNVSTKLLLSKEFLVTEIEDSINSRVQIGDLGVSLFSIPAKVTLSDVILTERESEVEMAVEYSDRKPLTEGIIQLNEVSFEVSLWELISKRIYVDSFDLDGLHAKMTLFENGKNSLDPLFGNPKKKSEKKSASKKSKKEKSKKSESFNAKEKEEFVTELRSVNIKNVSVDLLIEKTGMLVQGSGGSFVLSDIRVDPNSLEVVNQAKLELAAKFEVFDSASKTVKYAELGLSGDADTKLFDPATGDIDPDVLLDLKISDSSYISTDLPYLKKVWRQGEKLSKIGINVGSLPEKATFGRSRTIAGNYQRGRVDLTKDLSILLHDWEVAVNENAWFDSGSDEHAFRLDISASEKSSKSLTKHLGKLLKKLPRSIRGEMEEKIQNEWLLDGKLTLKLKTSGELSSPKIRSLTKLPDIDDLIKDYAKKGALDYLKKKIRF